MYNHASQELVQSSKNEETTVKAKTVKAKTDKAKTDKEVTPKNKVKKRVASGLRNMGGQKKKAVKAEKFE